MRGTARIAGTWGGTARALYEGMVFHKIMCPVDFSPGSREALEMAAALARDANAPLVLAHVWEPHWVTTGEFTLSPGVIQEMLDAEEAELAKWKKEAQKLGVKEVALRFLNGSPWDQIVSAALDEAIDVIVMGTHGRTGLKHALLGSVAEKVVRHAPCSVLVVRSRAVK